MQMLTANGQHIDLLWLRKLDFFLSSCGCNTFQSGRQTFKSYIECCCFRALLAKNDENDRVVQDCTLASCGMRVKAVTLQGQVWQRSILEKAYQTLEKVNYALIVLPADESIDELRVIRSADEEH
ncbi:hypothetical protein PPL_09906 [Heterostelium album PN500]|uniref:Uncharacterized protein n=1 Tax=Heterostelium pallidum (strain ATCC 26659 / Pp 5 / PN500) TaxID=670386 RepID=D3BPN9_HETP5|nr:hypothetical protein PPL_09906 [Heterostelium album PN500]EFA76601.1 hypothetical protein PPL_09906 [Heterostelium album PN500]|eukprot:XP_020428733.1 hypothetical protein PPL_09906 [Heterostelium album PN500]